MAQFGIHALIGLWIAWSLPSFSPYLIRFSFGAGIHYYIIIFLLYHHYFFLALSFFISFVLNIFIKIYFYITLSTIELYDIYKNLETFLRKFNK